MGSRLTLPIFTNKNKFDSTNWMVWSKFIHVATWIKCIFSYFDRSIKDPSAPASTISLISILAATSNTISTKTSIISVLLLFNKTLWNSLNLSAVEWNIWNAYTKSLLIYNIKNPIRLDINITGTTIDI